MATANKCRESEMFHEMLIAGSFLIRICISSSQSRDSLSYLAGLSTTSPGF